MFRQNLQDFEFPDITASEIEYLYSVGILNGCGWHGDGFFDKSSRAVIKFFLKKLHIAFFEASCGWHDFDYWKGGDEAKRKKCDDGFYEAIVRDIFLQNLGTFDTTRFLVYAWFFWLSVRVFGGRFFNYKK